jgi:uncharacterized membrane protein
MSLTYIAQQATIYAGIFLLVTDIVGNLLTILTFSSIRTYRTTSSTFYYLVGYLGLTSFTCSCLATIDQFFATSRNAYFRRFSTINWAHRIVFIVMIIWCFHEIPVFLFYNIPPVITTCKSTNRRYVAYTQV